MDVDIRKSIEANSDRLNADDLIGKKIIIRITGVEKGDAKSPVAVRYEGCGKKPWYPSKTMRRALVGAWGDRGTDWVGKSVELFRNPDVEYGGVKVGGIQISRFSDIPNDLTLMLTEKRGKKAKFEFKKLDVKTSAKPTQSETNILDGLPAAIDALRKATSETALNKMLAHAKFKALIDALGGRSHELTSVADEVRNRFQEEALDNNPDDF